MKITGLLCLLLFTLESFAARRPDDNLDLKLAQARKAQVKSVAYDLFFELFKEASGFKGKALIKVELNHQNADLSLDSMAKTIESVKVNGVLLKNYPRRKGSFDIPKKHLRPSLEVEVVYGNDYATTAGGLLRSKDPEDGAEYIYTDFEPYYAHNLFPSFDQPDLKAVFSVSVAAPAEWKVIQNELIESVKKDGDRQVTTFRPTPPLSTYLFFLGAGPFHEWKDSLGDLPLYLYARKSLVKFVDAENIFKTTKAGLKFFNEYFGYSYPFSKYGQLFIPEFAWGGMENPGAVTLNERNIFRGPVPASLFAKRDNLILHEMAHMWFGDLVTMEWWNDLWLNESFATYLASIAEERGLGAKATWISFLNTKSWGYWQDQLVTTHPIETEVPDVRTARGNFDGITYAKGASALKQLHFFVGEEGFREGLRTYFKTHAFRNTQRKDFIGAIGEASKTNLDDWTKTWLQTAGPNVMSFDFSCDDGKIKAASLRQEKSVSKTLSPHRTKVALFKQDDDELELIKSVDVVSLGEETPVKEAVGTSCPDFVLPNQGDQDYALYDLDKKSSTIAKDALTDLNDPLSRYMIWDIANRMLRDGKLPPQDYVKMAMEGLAQEEDDLLVGFLLGKHSLVRKNYFLYLSQKDRAAIAPKFEELLWNRVSETKTGGSLQMAFFDFLTTIVQTKESQDKLHAMLVKDAPPKGIVLDQDRRWGLIQALASNGHPEALKLRDEELKRDPSTLGKRMAHGVDAAWPSLQSKKDTWKEFFTSKDMTYSTFLVVAHNIHGPNTPELSTPFVPEFFKRITSMDWKSHDDVVDIYFEELFPLQVCTKEVELLSAKKLKAARNLTSTARRSWREAQDELERCVRVRSSLNVVKGK